MHREADGIISLVLDDRDGADLPAWEPGAHLEVRLPSGRLRHYSLCGDPGDRSSYRLAILDVVGGRGGSREIHEQVRAGQDLEVSVPRNHFELVQAESYLFIAGGIGITPILPMIAEVRRRGLPWRLVYGGRGPETMAFLDELPDEITVVHGVIDIPAVLAGSPGATVYCCGPEPLLDAVLFAAGSVHFERFAAAPQPPGAQPDRGFRVQLARTGRSVTVPADRTVLECLWDAGIDVPASCEQGICGSCETKVVAGVPDHRDSILTDAERAAGTSMMVCVSRCVGEELTLDL